MSWALRSWADTWMRVTRVIFSDLVLHYVRRHSLLARECCFPLNFFLFRFSSARFKLFEFRIFKSN